MTIKIPQPNLVDKLLRMMGKKRGVILSSGKYENFGPYTYFVAKKEGFFKSLIRSAKAPLPDGMVDIYFFDSMNNSPNGERDSKDSS